MLRDLTYTCVFSLLISLPRVSTRLCLPFRLFVFAVIGLKIDFLAFFFFFSTFLFVYEVEFFLPGGIFFRRLSSGVPETAKSSLLQYRQAVKSPPPFALQQKQRSFLTFGFGAGPARRESHVNVNVTPTSHDLASDTPEIRKYKKRFNSEILCAALWGA